MSWIKRNLYFLIGGVVAAALLGLAGWYFYSKYSLNNENVAELDQAIAKWNEIIKKAVGPGNDQVDNIANAREQQKKVRERIADVRKFFIPIAPIPNPTHGAVGKDEMASAIRSTILQLQRDAANASVSLSQSNYGFSFKAQQPVFNFPPGCIGPLSTQLGEVRAICDVLFRAKINSLDKLQRERVAASPDDSNGPPADYLEPALTSVTNEMAILTPYVITIHCFSSELGGVLAGFGNSTHGFIVKAINVDPGGAASTVSPESYGLPGEIPVMPNRFGPAGYPGGPAAAAPAPRSSGPPVILDEKPLQVVLVVDVVKLLPKK